MDFVTPDFGKAPRDDTTFNRKRMVCTEAQSFVSFGQLPLCIPSTTYLSYNFLLA